MSFLTDRARAHNHGSAKEGADHWWQQRVTAVAVLATDATLDLLQLRAWAKERLAAYKVPRELRLVDSLPRNALGKVTKKALLEPEPRS